jgi:hypothetical protein
LGREIDKALMQSRTFVVFWSTKSMLSEEVYGEAEYGMTKSAYFPILLERCQVPPRMSRVQWVDLRSDKPLESEAFHRLIDQLKKRIQESDQAPANA